MSYDCDYEIKDMSTFLIINETCPNKIALQFYLGNLTLGKQ